MLKKQNPIPQATGLTIELSNITANSEEALRAANAYKDIVDAVNSARNAVRNAKQAAGNATELCDGVEDRAGKSDQVAREMLVDARKSLATVQTDLQPHLNRSSDDVQKIIDRNEDSDKRATAINHALDQIAVDSQSDLWKNARDKAIEAQEQAQDALAILEPIVKDLPTELSSAKQMPKEVDDVNNDIAQARSQVDRVTSLLPDVTKLFKDLESKQDTIDRVRSDLGDRLEKLKEQIEMARIVANGIKVGVQFYPNTTLELQPPANLPLLEASSQISTYFKTDQPNGFLFYLGNENKTGKDDFMAVEIENGYPILTIDLGNGTKKIISNKHIANNQWHQVIVERTGNNVKLIVREELNDGKDHVHEVSDTVPGVNPEFNVDPKKSKLFVGGYPPDFNIQDGIKYSAFEGQIEDFRIGDQEIGLWNFVDAQDNNHGAIERDRLVASEAPATGYRFSGNGYVTLDSRPYSFKQRSTIQFKFKVARDTTDGLIFYAGKHRHFISIEMRGGGIFFQYKLGQHMVTIGSDELFNDDQWHLVEAVREGRTGILKVDRKPIYQEETAAGNEDNLKISDLMYFGGFPGKLNHTEITQRNFDGCIDDVYISGTPVDLSRHRQAYGVRAGCPTKFSTVLSYPPRQFGYLRRGNVSSDNHFQINLKFQTRQSDGLLFYATNHDQSATIGLALRDGALVMRSMKKELSTGNKKYNNGEWHVVRVIHDAKKLRLQVDDAEENSSAFDSVPLYIDHGDIYFGGLPKGFKTPRMALATTAYFTGCIKDVTLSGQVVNFANSTDRKSAILDSCSADILDYDASSLLIVYPEDDVEPIVRFNEISATNEIAGAPESSGGQTDDEEAEAEAGARERERQQEAAENARKAAALAAAEEIARKQEAIRNEETRRMAEENEAQRQAEAAAAERVKQEEKVNLEDRFNELDSENGDEIDTTTTTTTTPRPTRKRPVYDSKPEPICKLPVDPEVDVDFDAGYRFGTSSDSRIEFAQIPSKIKKSYSISLQFRTNEPDGVIFYAADNRHTDFIALYLQNGKVSRFRYLHAVSDKSILI